MTNGDIVGATTIMSAVFEATVVLPLRVRCDGYYGSGLVTAAKGAKAAMVETEAYTAQGGCEVV